MLLNPDTSKAGLIAGGAIACISLIFVVILFGRYLSEHSTDLPFPKAEATTDLTALRKSANDGNAESQLAMAGLYFVGKSGVSRDVTSAVQWLTRSAEQGNVTAQFILGRLYFDGEVVTEDPVTAKEWFAKAGHQGNADAQYYLGVIFATGKGAPASRVKAYVWWNLAKAQGHEEATKELEALEGKMSSEEIAEAQTLTIAKQEEIKSTINTPENSMSRLLKETQLIQDELREKSEAAEAELERIRQQDGDASNVLENALPSVVTVLVFAGEDISQGTAFFVDDYTLVTNFHVVEPVAYESRIYPLGEGPPVLIIDNEENARLAQVVATGEGMNDLAVLSVSNLAYADGRFSVDTPSPYPSLALQTSVKQGQTVFAVGTPQGLSKSIAKGIIGALRSSDSGVDFIQTDVEITHGNSGGPLLNTASQVVGVNTLRLDEGLKFAIAASTVDSFLSEIPSRNKGITYLDPSDYNGSSTTTEQPTYYERPTTTPTPTPSQTYTPPTPSIDDCSEFGPNAIYSYSQATCVCKTGYYASENGESCLKVPNCVLNSTFNFTSKQCECDSGYYVKGGKCYEIKDCPYNSTFDKDTDKCYCDDGYVAQNGSCVSEYSACGYGGTYNSQTGGCDCRYGYYMKNGSCELEPSCYGGTFNPQTGGCICDSDYYPKDGSCKRKEYCGEGGYFSVEDERCVCNAGYSFNGYYCSKDYNY
jgi:S1-C subfamily serine protease